jgi:hypothetical protein
MPLYPLTIRRCQHIRVDGRQCGSPALRDEKYCSYHRRWTQKGKEKDVRDVWAETTLPPSKTRIPFR